MSEPTVSTAGSWDEMPDRDIERLLSGESPENRELASLESLVSTLSTFSESDLREEFVQDYSKLAALMVNEARPPMAPRKRGLRTGHLSIGTRRRAAAGVAGLMMFSGLAGVAWASDNAVPGDWNYGIDRVMEVFGIGDGGAEERLLESVVVTDSNGDQSDDPGNPAEPPGKPADPGKPPDTPGPPAEPPGKTADPGKPPDTPGPPAG